MNLQVKKNLISVLAFVGFIWAVYLINVPLGLAEFDLNRFGLEPRTLHGLIGIFTMPFLHDGLNHVLGNTVPLVVLLLMLAFTRPNPKRVIICLTVMSGTMLWVLGRHKTHVGASGLIYALAAYLMATGIYERKVVSAITAVLVGVLYGGTLFWGLLPIAAEHVSWEGHLLGAVAGGLFAAQTVGRPGRKQQEIATRNDSPIMPDVAANSADAG
ncbi:MAG: rhomboid family intramembrane serine protease [Planctomycetota bacterium]|nr:MAG: rhomboid family intramembrane serine protease [Planctomycetota bacterium]